jgi:hypothetical protein
MLYHMTYCMIVETHPEYQRELSRLQSDYDDRLSQIEKLRVARIHSVEVTYTAEKRSAHDELYEQRRQMKDLLIEALLRRQEQLRKLCML